MMTPDELAAHRATLADMLSVYSAPLEPGMTAERIRSMSSSEFARYRARVRGDEDTAPTRPTSTPVADDRPNEAPNGPGVADVPDFKGMSLSEYAQVRSQYIRPSQSARGLFDGR